MFFVRGRFLRILFVLSSLVTTVWAGQVTAAQIAVSWTDNSTNEAGFKVERKTGTTGAYVLLATTAANVTSSTDMTVTVGTTYCYRVYAYNSVGNSPYSNEACRTPDAQAPTVSITSPAPGATLVGTATVTASAADNVGVVGVQFRLDGVNLGGEDTTTPYSLPWDTTTIQNGSHALTVLARDGAGNQTLSAAITVTVNNAGGTLPTAGLAVAYNFNEGSGTTVTDASGSNRTGTVAGATWTTAGKYSNALSFNGGAAKVTSGLSAHATVRSYMGWTYRTGPGGGNFGRIFDKRTSGAEVELLYNDEAAKVYRYLRLWSGGVGSWTIPQPSANVWHHIAVVYDASSAANAPQMYVDGVAQVVTRAQAPSGTPLTNADPYIIGNRSVGDRGWSGVLDDVRIYSVALTAAQVQTAMATAVSTSTATMNAPSGLQVTKSKTTTRPQSLSTSRAPTVGTTLTSEASATKSALHVMLSTFRPATARWQFDLNGNGVFDGCGVDGCLSFGQARDLPVVGDWLGTGHAQVGSFDRTMGRWQLDLNGNGVFDGCGVDGCLSFGQAGDLPVVGDWLGTGHAQVGSFDRTMGRWQLDLNGNGVFDGCGVDGCLSFGQAGDLPVVGDWLGTGHAQVGSFDRTMGRWQLDLNGNGVFDGCGVDGCLSFGQAGDLPVVGDWLGTGHAQVGSFDPLTGLVELDGNGNGVFDGCRVDMCLGPLGQQGDLLVVGKQ